MLQRYGVEHSLLPIPWRVLSAERVLEVARRVRGLPRPVMVHAFQSDGVAAQAFAAAYTADLPAVSPRYFEETMAAGVATVHAPNVVLGPRPAGPEFGSYLLARGIRSVVYVGSADDAAAVHDRGVAVGEAGLEWSNLPADARRIAARVAVDGPWYVYGPELGSIRNELELLLGQRTKPSAPPVMAGR